MKINNAPLARENKTMPRFSRAKSHRGSSTRSHIGAACVSATASMICLMAYGNRIVHAACPASNNAISNKPQRWNFAYRKQKADGEVGSGGASAARVLFFGIVVSNAEICLVEISLPIWLWAPGYNMYQYRGILLAQILNYAYDFFVVFNSLNTKAKFPDQ